MELTLSDRINFSITALKKHTGILAIGMLFIIIGSFLIYIASRTDDPIFLYCFGGFFIGFTLFFLLYTMPSSLVYYYEQELVKKYGSYAIATINAREIEDQSYKDRVDNRINAIEEFHYVLSYTFEYKGAMYNQSFHVASKECFDRLAIGSKVPIKFLRTDPNTSSVRRVKLSKELDINKKKCM